MLIKTSHYLIENTIRFFPFDRTLYYGDKRVVLQTPASRILELLLKNQGEIVKYAVIYNTVWEENGVHVSSNTLHQHISQIRKVMRQAGITEDILSTSRGKGLTLSPTHQIEFIENPQGDISISLVQDIKDNNSPERTTPLFRDIAQGNLDVFRVIKKVSLSYRVIFITLFLSILLGVMWLIFFKRISAHHKPAENFFSYYKYVANNQNCRIFANPRSVGMIDLTIKKIHSCNGFNYAYLTKYQNGTYFSVIYCKDKISSAPGNICVSEQYLIDGSK